MVPTLNQFLLRVKSLFRRRRADRELAEELEFHQAMLRERLLRQGTPAGGIGCCSKAGVW